MTSSNPPYAFGGISRPQPTCTCIIFKLFSSTFFSSFSKTYAFRVDKTISGTSIMCLTAEIKCIRLSCAYQKTLLPPDKITSFIFSILSNCLRLF